MTLKLEFQHPPLSNDDDIRLIRLYPAAEFEDPIRVSIERYELARWKRVIKQDTEYWSIKRDLELARSEWQEQKASYSEQAPRLAAGPAMTEARSVWDTRERFAHLSFKFKELNDALQRSPGHGEFAQQDTVHTDPLLYEAVSYAWGEEQDLECIFNVFNNLTQSLRVRRNVVEMLRYLRRRSTQRQLWIDAICINQADNEEKEKQVKMMGDIYSHAAQVLIWVGLPAAKYQVLDNLERSKTTATAADIVAFQEFIHRRWFKRRWVIQEVIHARVATIVCGNRTSEFCTFVDKIVRLLQPWSVERVEPTKRRPGNQELLAKIVSLVELHRKEGTGKLQKQSMVALLTRFRAADCSDDRDRFYALNSLSITPVPVNYQHSFETLCYQFARTELIRYPLQLLSCAAAFPSIHHASASWMPDWTQTLKHRPLGSSLEDSPRAITFDDFVTIDGKTISIKAWPAGTIQDVKTFDQQSLTRSPLSRKYLLDSSDPLEQYRYFLESHRKPSTPHFKLGLDTVLVDTLTEGDFETRWGKTEPSDTYGHQFIRTVDRVMSGRTCFFTEADHFGMGPQTIQHGDVLVSMPGSRILIALRPLESDGENDVVHDSSHCQSRVGSKMKVVGDCYVPELLGAWPLEGEQELRTYTIV